MIDISGRAVRAGIRGFTAVAAVSCFAVMPQVTNIASAHTGGDPARAHDHTTPRRDHDGREVRDHGRGRADVVVDTKGPKGAIVPGRTYQWPFEVTNRGTVPARDVSLTARPHRDLKVVSVPPKCHYRKSGPLVCDIGLLPQGHTRRGVITATIVPRAHHGKSLTNPIQVTWRNAPRREQRLMAEFPPVQIPPIDVSPGAEGTAPAPGGKIPYPLMVTEHGPVTAESVVVRSPVGVPAQEGPCANGALPAKVAGKSASLDPAPGPCGAKLDDPAACGCSGRPDVPVVSAPEAAVPDRPVAAPCGAVRPVVIPAAPAVPPCALHRPVRVPPVTVNRPADAPAAAPCGVLPARPVAAPDRPLLPPCAQSGPAAWADEPAEAPCGVLPVRPVAVAGHPALPPCAQHGPVTVGVPATAPCHATGDRPVILPAPVVPAAVPCGAAQAKPVVRPAGPPVGKPAAQPAAQPVAQPVARPAGAADVPAATPCGAAAVNPGAVPAIPPCAQVRPNACGCLAKGNAPAAPAAAPAVPAVPAAPCAADAVQARPSAPSCSQDAPAAVHLEPHATPDSIEPMTPLTGPGKAAHDPMGRPHRHFPGGLGHRHHDCARQGTGFVCPLGSAPRHRPHVLNLHSPEHPHALHCVGSAGAGCHTRTAHPVAVAPRPVRGNLPTTGSSSALLALSGLGLAGAGVVLYRLSRTRTRREEA